MKLPHSVIVKSPGLLPMLYTARELSDALGIPERTLRDWLDGGAPHQRDSRKHIWINGKAFSQWVDAQRKPKRERRLSDTEAYCLRCNVVITVLGPERTAFKGKLVHIKGTCPHCGNKINRGARDGTISQQNQLSLGE
jgi:hypothetical protein